MVERQGGGGGLSKTGSELSCLGNCWVVIYRIMFLLNGGSF